MIIEDLTWIACFLTIWGTWEVSKLKPNTLKINILYGIGSLILLCIFVQSKNIPMTVMYCILLAFAMRGLYVRRIEQDKKDIDAIITKYQQSALSTLDEAMFNKDHSTSDTDLSKIHMMLGNHK